MYNYHTKPLRWQIEEVFFINNAIWGALLILMVGDIEVHSNCSERIPVQPDTLEYSTEIVPESARRQSTRIPQVKGKVQTLISVVAKKMKMSSNIAKRKIKKKKEEPEELCEEDWGQQLYSNSSNYVY